MKPKKKLTKVELLKLRAHHKAQWQKRMEAELKAIRESENIRGEDLMIRVK